MTNTATRVATKSCGPPPQRSRKRCAPDSAFRIGGDEFALLLPQTDSQQALALSRRVETVLVEMLEPLQLQVAVSMDHGIAIFPQDAEQADQLIRIADERLYRQKHANHEKTV